MTDDRLPLVTMSVKAYRQEHLVVQAIESVFAQTYPNLEIILSDDSSPDGTFAVMERMAADYRGPHRVRLNRNPVNLGIAAHSNRIWELASGRLLTGCAGDDIAHPDKVARLVEAWRASGGKAAMVHSAVIQIDTEGHELELIRPAPSSRVDPSPLDICRMRQNGIGATALYDRRILDVFGPLPATAQIEDGPMFFRAALLGGIAYVDAPLVNYRVGGVSDGRRHAGSAGRAYLYGQRITRLRWWAGNARTFLSDMEKVDFPEREACRHELRAFLAQAELQFRLVEAGTARRLSMIPEAARLGLVARSTMPLRHALRYAFAPLYVAYHDRRHGRS